MKKFSNTEPQMKKYVAYKNKCVLEMQKQSFTDVFQIGFPKMHRKTTVFEPLFNKAVGAFRLQLYFKKYSNTGVSCAFCVSFKSSFFTEHLQTTASEDTM